MDQVGTLRRVWSRAPIKASGLLDAPEAELSPVPGRPGTGDRGCAGTGMNTSGRKPPGRHPNRTDNKWNRIIGKIRYRIERTITNLKTWRVFYTDYHPTHILKDTPTATFVIISTSTPQISLLVLFAPCIPEYKILKHNWRYARFCITSLCQGSLCVGLRQRGPEVRRRLV